MKRFKCWYNEAPKWDRAAIKGHIILMEDACFFIEGIPLWVPKTDICDGASIPWLARFIVGDPCDKDNAIGAWFHDPGYETHALPRWICDECARQIWIQAGKPQDKVDTMYYALRAFGWSAWPNSEHQEIILEKTRQMILLRPDADKFKTLWFNKYQSLEDFINRNK